MDRRDMVRAFGPDAVNGLPYGCEIDEEGGFIVWAREDDEGYVYDVVQVPIKNEVCPTCEGRGKHVNPSIDAHGISRNEFDRDPQFEEDYRQGVYDVKCYQCKGLRVIPGPDISALSGEHQTAWQEAVKDKQEDLRERVWEARMGW